MRVLIISHGHPAFSIGGAEVASHNLFRGLRAQNHDAFYLARATTPIRRHSGTPLMSLRQSPYEVFLHNEGWDEFWLSNPAIEDLSGAFSRYLRHIQPDIVHFHHLIGLGVESLIQVKRVLPNAKIVLTLHEYLPICINHGQMIKTKRRALCHQASPADCSACFPQHTPGEMFQRELFIKHHFALIDAFVSPSQFLVDRFTAWGLPHDKFCVIENGLDARPQTPPRPLALGGRRDRFAFFGQITEFKGLHIILDAIHRIPAEVWGNASLNVYGGNLEFQPPEFQERFARLLDQVGPRARFFGAYRPEDLPRLMAQADWTVVPSIWWENSPVVIQEAFLHGRPPIVSDIGGMAEKVTPGVNGLQFRVSSPEDLADCLTQAMTTEGLWDRLRDGAPVPPDLTRFSQHHVDLYAQLSTASPISPYPKGHTADNGHQGVL